MNLINSLMMKPNSILFSEKKKVVKYNSKSDNYEWELDFEYKVYGISRIDNLVFITTYSNWGKSFTNLVDFENGKKLWRINEVFYSVHIVGDTLIYLNNKKYYTGINLKSGVNLFSIKPPFKWSTPKAILLNGKFYLYTSKKTYILNLQNGNTIESSLPNKLNPKEIGLVLDEFQISINNMPSAGGDFVHTSFGDAGSGDAGGGDAGGGGA